MSSIKDYRRSKQTRRRTDRRQGHYNINKNTQPKDRHLRHVQAKLDVDVEPTNRPRRRGRRFRLHRTASTTWGWDWDTSDSERFFGCEGQCCMPQVRKRDTLAITPGDEALMRHMGWPQHLVRLPVADSPRVVYYYDHVNVTLYSHCCDCERCENGPHVHCRRNPRMTSHTRAHARPSELSEVLQLRATLPTECT